MVNKPERADIDLTALDRLASAIIIQAVEDYRKAIRGDYATMDTMDPAMRKRECERFFLSGHFASLTNLNGAALIRQLREELTA